MIRPESFSPSRFSRYALELSQAVYELRTDMSVQALREALRGTQGAGNLTLSYAPNGNQIISIGDRTIEVGPMAGTEEILQALVNPFTQIELKTGTIDMSLTGLNPGAIRAAIDAAKQKSQDDVAKAMAGLAAAQTKAATVPDAINQLSAKMVKEADDALQELAEFTNGGPA